MTISKNVSDMYGGGDIIFMIYESGAKIQTQGVA